MSAHLGLYHMQRMFTPNSKITPEELAIITKYSSGAFLDLKMNATIDEWQDTLLKKYLPKIIASIVEELGKQTESPKGVTG